MKPIEMVSWLLDSRRRLTKVALVAAGVVLALGAVTVAFGLGRASSQLHRNSAPSASPSARRIPAVTSPQPGNTARPQASPTASPSTGPVAAALSFMAAWGNYTPGEALETWRDGLKPYATTTLYESMEWVDISTMHPYRVVQAPDEDCQPGSARSCRSYQTGSSAQYMLLLDSGDQVMVTVVTDDGQHWLADSLTPAEGN